MIAAPYVHLYEAGLLPIPDFAEEQPGWEQADGPLSVVREPYYQSDAVVDLVDFSLDGPGWLQSPEAPPVLRLSYSQADSYYQSDPIDVAVEDPGWIQSPISSPVLRLSYYHPDTVMDQVDFSLEEPGWIQTQLSVPVLRRNYYLSETVDGQPTEDAVEDPGWIQSELMLPILRLRYHQGEIVLDLVDFGLEGPGWIQSQEMLPVLRRLYFEVFTEFGIIPAEVVVADNPAVPTIGPELLVRPEDLVYARAVQQEDTLTFGDMVLLRLEAEKLLPDIVIIQTVSKIQDGQGGLEELWSNSYLNVPARFAEIGSGSVAGNESQAADREHLMADYRLTLPYDQDIDETMRVEHEGQVYEVVFVNHARSHDTARRCLVRRV